MGGIRPRKMGVPPIVAHTDVCSTPGGPRDLQKYHQRSQSYEFHQPLRLRSSRTTRRLG